MKTHYLFKIILILAIILNVSCSKEKEAPAEEINVVKWKQNGEWHRSEDPYWSEMPNDWGISYKIYEDSSSYFSAYDWPDDKHIKIYIQAGMFRTGHINIGIGHYDLYAISGNFAKYCEQVKDKWVDYYTRPGSGWVEIQWMSKDKRKFKGYFEMTLYNEQGGSVQLTDGYFNIDMDRLDEEHYH